MAKDLAIVVANGGINSAVTAALASQRHRTIMLYADAAPQPGSRRTAYDLQVAHFKPYRDHTLSMPFMAPLSAARPAPPARTHQASPTGTRMLDLLPLIAVAARYAVQYGASSIHLGLCIGVGARDLDRGVGGRAGPAGSVAPLDSANLGKPGDDSARATEYVQIWNEMLNLPCEQPDLSVVTPILELEPWQVVDVGFQAGVPFEKTWSCLEDGAEPCWACRGCRSREAAFQQAAKADPLRVAKKS